MSNDKNLNLPAPRYLPMSKAQAAPVPAPTPAPTPAPVEALAPEAPAPKNFGHVMSNYQAAKTADKVTASSSFEPEIHVVDLHDTHRYPAGNKGYAQARREQAAQSKVYHTVLTEAERQGCRERGQAAFDKRSTLDPKSYFVRREVARFLNNMLKDEDPRLAMFSYEIAAANFR